MLDSEPGFIGGFVDVRDHWYICSGFGWVSRVQLQLWYLADVSTNARQDGAKHGTWGRDEVVQVDGMRRNEELDELMRNA